MRTDTGHDGDADPGIVARRVPPYCVQNNGECETCSLVNYGRDCANMRLAQGWEE